MNCWVCRCRGICLIYQKFHELKWDLGESDAIELYIEFDKDNKDDIWEDAIYNMLPKLCENFIEKEVL